MEKGPLARKHIFFSFSSSLPSQQWTAETAPLGYKTAVLRSD